METTTNNITIEQMVSRWDSNKRPLFKGKLIDKNGCCCAQGDVLRCAGYTDEQLRNTNQNRADKEVAKLLGITLAESILLRTINDKKDGCPQDVFRNRKKILGKHHKLWTAFARHVETLSEKDVQYMHNNYNADRNTSRAAHYAARTAAHTAAYIVAPVAAGIGAGAAAAAAHADVHTSYVAPVVLATSYELLGWSVLEKPYFLCFFFDDPVAWVKAHEGE